MTSKSRRIAKFLISGGTAATIEYCSFILLVTALGGWLLAANIISFLLGFVSSFMLNKSWVFQSDGDTKKQLMMYVLLASVNLVISTMLIILLVNNLKLHALIGKLLVMGLVALWNYLIFSKLIFINHSK